MSQIISDVEKKASLRRGDPISCLGLTFYPIKMSHYDTFLRCKDALTLRQGTLPVRYLSLDFLSAVFAFEIDRVKRGETVGLIDRIFRLLALALRVEPDSEYFESLRSVKKMGDLIVPSKIVVTQQGNRVEIEPFVFSSMIRPLLAEQNGLLLPSEEDNAELVRAYEQKNAIVDRTAGVKPCVEDLIASVAYLSGVREREIYEWTVGEFDRRKRAIDRDKRYMLYNTAELSGNVTFKEGNPAKFWCFDTTDENLGTMKTAELEKTLSGTATST